MDTYTIAEEMYPDGIIRRFDRSRLEGARELVIPEGITEIGANVFEFTRLAHVVFPQSLRIIGERAFAHCRNMRSVTIPAGVEEVGNQAFCFSSAITAVRILSEQVKLLGSGTFRHAQLETLYWKGHIDAAHILPPEEETFFADSAIRLVLGKYNDRRAPAAVRAAVFLGIWKEKRDPQALARLRETPELSAAVVRSGNLPLLQEILDTPDSISAQGTDAAIGAAIEAQQPEMLALLLRWKEEHFGYADAAGRMKL